MVLNEELLERIGSKKDVPLEGLCAIIAFLYCRYVLVFQHTSLRGSSQKHRDYPIISDVWLRHEARS